MPNTDKIKQLEELKSKVKNPEIKKSIEDKQKAIKEPICKW